jgi:putative redox protein
MTSEVSYQGKLRTVCTHLKSRSSIETDAPVDNNGNGERFSPTDLVATALASCMITVMGIRAQLSGIPFETVSASVQKSMGISPRRITEIKVEIVVHDSWSDKQREIMEQVARGCPVAQSLSPELVQNVSFKYT